VKFIRFHHVPLVLFLKHGTISAQGLSPLSPATTWFATNFFMVARVLNMKEALKQTVTDMEWNTNVLTLSDMEKKPV
jgi:hypothetical protein